MFLVNGLSSYGCDAAIDVVEGEWRDIGSVWSSGSLPDAIQIKICRSGGYSAAVENGCAISAYA